MENFNIFLEIEKKLNDEDEIYLDITHSFRSLALFEYMMINFAENISNKRIKIKGIFYGMLDISREMENKVPVANLKKIHEISQWIKGLSELKNYGNGYIISELLMDKEKDLVKSIKMYSDLMNLNYLGGIQEQHKNLKKKIEEKRLTNTEYAPAKFVND